MPFLKGVALFRGEIPPVAVTSELASISRLSPAMHMVGCISLLPGNQEWP